MSNKRRIFVCGIAIFLSSLLILLLVVPKRNKNSDVYGENEKDENTVDVVDFADLPSRNTIGTSSLLSNWDFEDDSLDPWESNAGNTIQRSADHAYLGEFGGLVYERVEWWDGIGQDVSDIIQPYEDYTISIWAKLVDVEDSSVTATFMMTMAVTYDSVNYEYFNILYTESGLTNEWKQFEATYQLQSSSSQTGIPRLFFYAEGPASEYSFAVDNVVVEISNPILPPQRTSVVWNWDFEDPTIVPWNPNGPVTIQKSADHAFSGMFGGLITGRSEGTFWHGINQQLFSQFEIGESYDVSISAKLVNVPSGTQALLKLTMAETYDWGVNYATLIYSEGILSDEWQIFYGNYFLAGGPGKLLDLILIVEGPENDYDFAIDDVIIVPKGANPTASPTFYPTHSPTLLPIRSPTQTPTQNNAPTKNPTDAPAKNPTNTPTNTPTENPTDTPTKNPTDAPVLPSSIVINWNFENPTIQPWNPNGPVNIQKTDQHACSGKSAGLVTERSGDTFWHGINQQVFSQFKVGAKYDVSICAKLVNVPDGTTARFKLTMAEEYDGGYQYISLIYSENGLTNEWRTFYGSYVLQDGSASLRDLVLIAEGPQNNYDFAIDDVIITEDLSTPGPTAAPELAFVSSTDNTDQVVIPHPPNVSLDQPRFNCPHMDDSGNQVTGHVTWEDQFGSSLNGGQDVILPEDTSILVSGSIGVTLGIVTIPASSQLIFDEIPNGISLNVEGIEVKGALIAGSETCRYQTPLTITLHGSRPEGIPAPANARPLSYKGIDVTGRLELHGKRYYRTWTRLARRVVVGENYLYLQDEVNWETGQEIVLITSAIRDSRDWHENEVLTILRVETTDLPSSAVRSVVYLTSTIEFSHIARAEYQAEVGLLTRMIKVEGSEADSEPTDTSPASCTVYDHEGNTESVFGYDQVSCPNTYLTGFGGHVIIHSGGVGYVEGVELYRMGQTNVLGRYPMHFHVLGDGCQDCYLKDSSIHRSFYRCVSIHGTSSVTVSENVGYDVIGFCYYLEDGVEEFNTLSYNLAAHIHFIGSPAIGTGQEVSVVEESFDLTLPADIAASGFYITNLHNTIVGNVAVGGWSGFAMPVLSSPIGHHKDIEMDPSTRTTLVFDGNSAHSTAHFWRHAAAFYFGGSLYYEGDMLVYNAGRDQGNERYPCTVHRVTGECIEQWNRITNSKVFLVPNVGIGSWSGRMEVINYECHDIGLALEALVAGFWIDKMIVVCRTGENLILPVQRADFIEGNGFVWYDTDQEHIITDSRFQNCGYRSDEWNQYDTSETRGCGGSYMTGCAEWSSVFGFLTHSNQFNPEIMQATKNLTIVDVGRRFRFNDMYTETVSGRTQNWLDVDGSVTGLGEATIIASGYGSTGAWWRVDDDVVEDNQGPLVFVQQGNGPRRGLAHIRLQWDDSLHDTVGYSSCGNDSGVLPCEAVGSIRHLGEKFGLSNGSLGGLPITAQADVAGLAGGYGWLLELDSGAPHTLRIKRIEVMPDTPLLFSLAYPLGSSVTVTAKAGFWCYASSTRSCEENFSRVSTIDAVRFSDGNVYHFDDATGLLTIRIVMFPQSYTGEPNWKLYNFNDLCENGSKYCLERFERDGILLPVAGYHQMIEIVADCEQNGAYCADAPVPSSLYDDVCSVGFEQDSYDRCCEIGDSTNCNYPY